MLLLSLAPYSHSMSTFRDLGPNRANHATTTVAGNNTREWDVCIKDLPVAGDVEVKVTDMRCIFRQNNVASELPRSEPEGKVGNIVELEFCMDPAGEEVLSISKASCNLRNVFPACLSQSVYTQHHC